MRIDWDTPVDVLMHGDNIGYIDLDEDEICHWKYIKRVKTATGWRYYYDEEAYKRDNAKVTAEAKNAQKRMHEVGKQYYQATKKYRDAGLDDGRKVFINDEIKIANDYKKAKRQYENIQSYFSTAMRAIRKHNKMLVRNANKKIVTAGLNKIAKLFSKKNG